MRLDVRVDLRGRTYSGIYHTGAPPSWDDPGDPDGIEVPDLPDLDPSRHPNIYDHLIGQARDQFAEATRGRWDD